jgi:F-type H+-transporting ATPase subunit b
MFDKVSLLLSEEKGGLFDIGASVPLIAVQFLALMFILDNILYSPLIEVINSRNTFILGNLSKASELIASASEITKKYEEELLVVRKSAQQDLATSQKSNKEILELELQTSQKYINDLVTKIFADFGAKKEKVLVTLESETTALSNQILDKLFV